MSRREIKNGLKQQTAALAEQFNGLKAHLVIIQVGGRDDSNVYIRQKIKSAVEIGVAASHVQFPKTITQNEVCKIVIFVFVIWYHLNYEVKCILIINSHYGFLFV